MNQIDQGQIDQGDQGQFHQGQFDQGDQGQFDQGQFDQGDQGQFDQGQFESNWPRYFRPRFGEVCYNIKSIKTGCFK